MMKSVAYLALVLITTSCSSLNYFGDGKLKKVRVEKSNENALVSNQEMKDDSLFINSTNSDIQQFNSGFQKETPNKSLDGRFQHAQLVNLKMKLSNNSRQNIHSGFNQKSGKNDSNIVQKTGTNNQLKKNQNNPSIDSLKELGQMLIFVAVCIVIIFLIMYFKTNPQALIYLGLIILIAVVIGIPIYIVITLINGDSVDIKVIGTWLGAILGLLYVISEM